MKLVSKSRYKFQTIENNRQKFQLENFSLSPKLKSFSSQPGVTKGILENEPTSCQFYGWFLNVLVKKIIKS